MKFKWTRIEKNVSTKLLIGLYGEELALTDRSLLKLVLPVLDSDGKDMQAVEVLCKALKA